MTPPFFLVYHKARPPLQRVACLLAFLLVPAPVSSAPARLCARRQSFLPRTEFWSVALSQISFGRSFLGPLHALGLESTVDRQGMSNTLGLIGDTLP